jgi:nitroimidazol reductase NimA-like FMN-containing flavoprotein (pyridoxamine 5'-phosphate oxidase superfamily)
MPEHAPEPDFRQIALEVLASCKYLVLATSTDSRPWATPLMFAFRYPSAYWVGALDSDHSRNIEQSAAVAATVFDTRPVPGQAQALYLRGHAARLTGDDLIEGCDAFYSARYPDPDERRVKGREPIDFVEPSPRGMWRMEVTEASLLDPRKHPQYGSLIDHRVVIPVDHLA